MNDLIKGYSIRFAVLSFIAAIFLGTLKNIDPFVCGYRAFLIAVGVYIVCPIGFTIIGKMMVYTVLVDKINNANRPKKQP